MKCFLSHSSKYKRSYVDIVAQRLEGHVEYDQETFEIGLKSSDEIMRGLKQSEIFVLFISEHSLNSSWVKIETDLAEKLSEEGRLKIYPLIIDPNINHRDERIPKWMKS
ncbi:MAG: toll/interleukin-1 receptor domain-containing protein [Synechocystis sp.]